MDVELLSSSEPSSVAPGGPLLTITGADLQLALLRLLKFAKQTTEAKIQGRLIHRDLLAKLAASLYSMKTSRGLPSRAMRAAIARSLTATVVSFRQDMESFLLRGTRAAPGERLVLLRQLRPEERLEVPRGAEGSRESMRMALSAPPLVKEASGIFRTNSSAEEEAKLTETSLTRLQRLEVRACFFGAFSLLSKITRLLFVL